MTTPSIMFVAGEASGDAHAARVIAALKAAAPKLAIFGAGGQKMQAAGLELRLDLPQHAVVGLVEVLKNYRKFKCLFDDLLRDVEKQRPAVLVLVDFPGFNLRFARAVKQRFPETKIVYYISPQLWAWHASRAKQIERDVDLMLTIFPFEKDWYAQHAPNLRVEFVGHPFADQTGTIMPPANRNPKLVLLLPGSREREVAKIFPIMAGALNELPTECDCVVAAANSSLAQMIRHPRVRVEVGKARELMARAAVAIVASGTATMECAFLECPMVVVYKVNFLTYLVGRALVNVKWLGMPNVIAGREIVPEFIQHHATPARVGQAALQLLQDPVRQAEMKRDLAEVVRSLGGSGAAERAAKLILAELETPSTAG